MESSISLDLMSLRAAYHSKSLTLVEPVIDLVVEVQKTKAGVVAFGPGWSLNKGWNYGAEASYSNIGGEGRLASIRGSFSEEKDQYAIGNKTLVGRKIGAGYTEPYLLDQPIDERTKAHQKAEWSGELWGLRFGGEIEFVHKLRQIVDPAQVSIFYSPGLSDTFNYMTNKYSIIAICYEAILGSKSSCTVFFLAVALVALLQFRSVVTLGLPGVFSPRFMRLSIISFPFTLRSDLRNAIFSC